jgi:flagellar FliJ protein
MAKFIFKLEGVLRQRKHIEQEKQRQLAVRQKQLVELHQVLREMQQTVETTNDDLRKNRLIGRLNMEFIAAHRRFLTGMQKQAMGIAQKMAIAQRSVDEARLELAEAAKQRKAIEKLKEKQLERWRAEQSRRESAELDEIGMQLAYQNISQDVESGA